MPRNLTLQLITGIMENNYRLKTLDERLNPETMKKDASNMSLLDTH